MKKFNKKDHDTSIIGKSSNFMNSNGFPSTKLETFEYSSNTSSPVRKR